MKAEDILSALNLTEDDLVRQAGIAGGHIQKRKQKLHASRKTAEAEAPVPLQSTKKRPLWSMAAAVLLLVVAAGSFWALLRHPPEAGSTPVEGVSNPSSSTATEAFVLPDPATEPDGLPEPDPELEAALLELRIGGLYLGQPQEEVLALYGEPERRSAGSDDIQTDGTKRDSWRYHFGEEQSLFLSFVDAGEGFVVNEILASANLPEPMPFGIYIGQPFEEAVEAFRESPVLDAAKVCEEADKSTDKLVQMTGNVYVIHTDRVNCVGDRIRHIEFSVSYFDAYKDGPHCVGTVCLGRLYGDPPYETPDPEETERNQRFCSDEITVWLPEGEGWRDRSFRAEEAKALEVQFSVSLPEPWDYDGSAPIAAADFHNGYAAVLFDEREHGGVYRITDRAAFEQGLAAGDPLRGLELWEYVQFAPDTLNTLRDPAAVSADWDLNYAVGARLNELLAAVREKDAELFTSSDGKVALFKEKGHYVIAGAFDGGDTVTAYARFSEEHALMIDTNGMPMIGLDEPETLLGMDLTVVRETWGEPVFTEKRAGETCPCYITRSGYIVLLRLQFDLVTSIELWDHAQRPEVCSVVGLWNDRWLYTPGADPCEVVREAVSRQVEKVYTVSVAVEEVRLDETEKQKIFTDSSAFVTDAAQP